MDSRFLSSEEQAMHFPLKTSPHYQLSRKLFCTVAFCLTTNFSYAELRGTSLCIFVCQQRVMVHARTGIEKRQGEAQAGISAQLHRARCFGCFIHLRAYRSWEPDATVCWRCISSCFAPLWQQKTVWVCQQIFYYFCFLALSWAEKERSPFPAEGELRWGGCSSCRQSCNPQLHNLAITSRDVGQSSAN